MILGLGGNDRLLHPCQKLLRLRQRQPQIRDLAKVVGPADLQYLHTPCPAVGPRFHQLQNPPHPRSPSRQRPDRSYRFRPYPPSLWTLPLSDDDLKPLWHGAEAYIREWGASMAWAGSYSPENWRRNREKCRELRAELVD